MCTVTFYLSPNTMLATMNRDEANMRGPETPPQLHECPGASNWAAPHDSDKGGTWMGVNDRGVAACLLNAYRPGENLLPDPNAPNPSRGLIIPALMPLGGAAAIDSFLRDEFDPEPYLSFTLFVVGRNAGHCYEWFPGEELSVTSIDRPWHMRTSCGWDTVEVSAWRGKRFSEWIAQGSRMVEGAPAFHFLLEEGAEERSPLMRREWSSTRSVTQAEVDFGQGAMTLRYWGEPQPGGGTPSAVLSLNVLPEGAAT